MKKILLTLIVALTAVISVSANVNIQQLSAEKNRLIADSNRLAQRHQLLNNAEYKNLSADAAEAAKNYSEAQRKHPELTILAKQKDAAMRRMTNAQKNSNQNVSVASSNEYRIVHRNLETASNNIPEIVELRKKSEAAQELVRSKRKSLISALPEGKAILDKIDALDKKNGRTSTAAEPII